MGFGQGDLIIFWGENL